MKKFAVHTETFEFDPTKHATAQDAYWASDDHNDEVVAICGSLEEAKVVLAEQAVATHHYSRKLAASTVAFIGESEYELDENGEWEFISGMDVCEFKYE